MAAMSNTSVGSNSNAIFMFCFAPIINLSTISTFLIRPYTNTKQISIGTNKSNTIEPTYLLKFNIFIIIIPADKANIDTIKTDGTKSHGLCDPFAILKVATVIGIN